MALKVDIKKNFGEFTLDTAFEIDGDVMGILGASGCGKSMTLRCIAGIVTPDEGRIELDGTVFFDSEKKINLKPQERRVGLLFQNYALFPNMTVYQNLMMGLKPYEKDKKKIAREVRTMIDRFYLTGLESHKPSQLSGGQQQRTALARILLSKPRLLMLDEPFSALDGYLRWQMELELRDILKNFTGSTLFVTHSRSEIYRICNQVCVMERGTSSPVIPVKQLFEYPSTKASALLSGCKNYAKAEALGEKRIYAEEWGVELQAAECLPEKLSSVGVRSHYIRPVEETQKEEENTFSCKIMDIIEDVFSVIIMVRPEQADKNAVNPLLRIEAEKSFWETYSRNLQGDRIYVQIRPEDIMLLTE